MPSCVQVQPETFDLVQSISWYSPTYSRKPGPPGTVEYVFQNPHPTIQVILGGDDPKALNQARESPDWPEWDKAIQTELEQLARMGTWQLAQLPINGYLSRIIINLENLSSYKAWLVAKGCTQWLGKDYYHWVGV
jgi:hypothetical protein